MTAFAMVGALVVMGIVVAGVYWLITNITFKTQPEPYTYMKDKNGDEFVKDNTDA